MTKINVSAFSIQSEDLIIQSFIQFLKFHSNTPILTVADLFQRRAKLLVYRIYHDKPFASSLFNAACQ